MVDNLSLPERQELDQLEAKIEKGIGTFVEVGLALLSIRDRRLYRGAYSTFEAYCLDRWGMTRTHANRLIGAAEVAGNLAPTGAKPACERVARPLTRLEPEEQRAVWKDLTDNGHEPTAAEVEEMVREMEAACQMTPAEVLRERVEQEQSAARSRAELDRRREAIAAKRRAARKCVRLGGLDGGEQETVQRLAQPLLDYLDSLD